MGWFSKKEEIVEEPPTAEEVVAEVIEDDEIKAQQYSKRTNIEVLRE